MSVTHRLLAAMNDRDATTFAAAFADDYRSEQPTHPSRAFQGSAQVKENWTGVFAGVPDFAADLLSYAVDGDTELGEWVWHGSHGDGSRFEMRGVTVLGIVDDLVQWGRLYMEVVEHDGSDIRQMVKETYRPPES